MWVLCMGDMGDDEHNARNADAHDAHEIDYCLRRRQNPETKATVRGPRLTNGQGTTTHRHRQDRREVCIP